LQADLDVVLSQFGAAKIEFIRAETN